MLKDLISQKVVSTIGQYMPFGLQQGIHVDSLQWSNVLSGTLFFGCIQCFICA